MKYNLTSHLYLKADKLNSKGEAPIYLRITLNGIRLELSTKRTIEPDRWNIIMGRGKGNKEDIRILNNYLDNMVNSLNRNFNLLIDKDEPFDVCTLKDRLTGKARTIKKTLLQIFEENNQLIEQEAGTRYGEVLVSRYDNSLKRLQTYMNDELGVSDITLDKLNHQFMHRYEIFLRKKYKCQHNTAMNYLKQLKKVIHQAIVFGYLDKDPFLKYKTSYREVNRGYLTQQELQRIENKIFKLERLNTVKDIFLFTCYTGLSYSDLKKLTPEDITIGIDGGKWIVNERNKTGVRFSLPLLPKALEILDKYKNHPECVVNNLILPLRSNQKMNSYLHEIEDLCEINKSLTCHIGRHTFATTVTLTNGVPIETVSKMLGHKNLQTTQIYCKVIDSKISEDMKKIIVNQ
jgi:integrase